MAHGFKTLLFDNNGVITTDNEEKDLSDLFLVELDEFKIAHKPIVEDYGLGKISVTKYLQLHKDAFNSKHNLDLIKKVHLDSYLLIPEVKKFLIQLKDKYELAMLTNFGEAFEEANSGWKLEDVFEKNKIFVSSKVGLLKPDTKFYLYALKNLKRKPSEVVFIDDREKNVASAIKLGMHGILFKDIKQLKTELNNLQ